MKSHNNSRGTHSSEFSVGTGDIETAGSSIIDTRTTSDGFYEYRQPGQPWRRIGANNDGAKEPTGFVADERDDSTLSVVDGTRTFSITPTGASFRYYVQGAEVVVSSQQSVVFPDTDGIHYMYFDADGVLVTTMVASEWVSALLGGGVLVSFVQWDATNGETIFLAEERHGMMPGLTHYHLHLALGMQWYSGGALTDFEVEGTGDANSNAQFGVSAVSIGDEDIALNFSNGSPQTLAAPAQIPVYFREGANGYWRKKASDAFPLIYSGTAGYTGANGRAPYNEWTGTVWQLTEVLNLDFFLVHYYATNEISQPIIGVHGQASYRTVTQARNGARTEINQLSISGLDIAEFTALGSVIFQTSGNYANTPASRVRQVESGVEYVDWRNNEREGAASAGVTVHGQLDGLLEDDHTQYLLIDGTREMTGSLDMGTNAVTNVGNVDGRDVSADGTALDTHVASTSDPHDVTATQVGLGNVPNLDTTDAVNNEHTHTNKAQLDLVTDGDHDARTDNPHSATAAQVEAIADEASPSGLSSGQYVLMAPAMLMTVDDASTVSSSPLYIASDGNMDRCDASAIATMPCRGIALEAGAGAGHLVMTDGFLGTTQTWSTIGGEIYVSETTGALTQTPFTTASSVVQSVGYAVSANVMRVKIGDYTEN